VLLAQRRSSEMAMLVSVHLWNVADVFDIVTMTTDGCAEGLTVAAPA
jgi:hypothetical protein